MAVHVDAPPAKGDSLEFESQPLFQRIFARHADRAARAYYAMPWQPLEGAKSSNHLARGSRKTGRGGDLSVAGHLPSRDLADRVRHYG
jgi:hypothetical protein